MSNNKLIKAIQLILKNKDIIIADHGLFSPKTLTIIQAIINSRFSNDFTLTNEQQQLIIESFINLENVFTAGTPDFIIENPECFRLAITRDINSVNYLKEELIDSTSEKYILDEALKQGLVLTDTTPNFLKSNFQVAYNSVKLNINSANYIAWSLISESEVNILIDELISGDYSLSPASHPFLTKNVKLILAIINKHKNNIKYISEDMKLEPLIFKSLMLKDYDFIDWQITERSLECFTDYEVLEKTFKKLNFYKFDNPQYIERFTKLYHDILNSKLLIKDFEPSFRYIAENLWKNYRRECFDFYDNIFGKICAELRNTSDFQQAINNLIFLEEIENILGDTYHRLFQTMANYYHIYHSEEEDKSVKLEPLQNIIAELSALYVSKSKDKYIQEMIEACYGYISKYFSLKLDHPYIYKQLTLSAKKAKFRQLYQQKDPEISNFINKLIENHNHESSTEVIYLLVDDFLNNNYSKTLSFIETPDYYQEYVRYEKVLKLIRRLNNGYIHYDGVEVHNYLDVISFDDSTQEYIYTGKQFTPEEMTAFNDYRKILKLYDKIKKAIMIKVNSLECNNFDYNRVVELSDELPFTDEYFVYDNQTVLTKLDLRDLIETSIEPTNGFAPNVILSDEAYSKIYDLLVTKRMIWLLIFTSCYEDEDLEELGITTDNVLELVNNMEQIIKLSKEFNFDLNNLGELLLVHEISTFTDAQALAILGKTTIEKLCKHQTYTAHDSGDIITKAQEMICHMVKRSASTVPYIRGSFLNYHYSMYDPQDVDILTAGIDTDACFRITGNDNDFLHYCALDKNGFVIKITDDFGNFIARASGFRNGNCVFINQLRTIYDEGGNGYLGEYDNEKRDIIKTFKQACQEIVETSQNNCDELTKIDFVFVTKSYSLKRFKSNVSQTLKDEIGSQPMDNTSNDWNDFINTYDNLEEAPFKGCFTTDYGDYPLICPASSKPMKNTEPCDIVRKDVPALYKRPRNSIMVTQSSAGETPPQVNKIHAIECFFQDREFTPLEIPNNSIIITGDNWYIIYHQGKFISSCLLEFDDQAKSEFQTVKHILDKYQTFNHHHLPPEKLVNILETSIPSHHFKKLIKIPSKS